MSKLKITVVARKKNGDHINDLRKAAAKKQVEINVVNFSNLQDLKQQVESLGDVIIWRSSDLDIKSERTAVGKILQNKILINRAIFDNPYVTYKLFQQELIKQTEKINYIPTFQKGIRSPNFI